MSDHSIGRRHGLWLAAGLALCGALAIVGLAPAGLAGYGTPITVTFRDAFPTDQIGSDGGGPYVNGGAVEAVLDASGDLHLDTDLNGRPGGRTLSLNFADPVPGCTNCNPPFTKATLVDAFMSTSSVAVGGTAVAGLPGMPVGSTGRTNLNVNFAGWFVRFNPSAYGGSTQVSVTRNDGQHWTIEASSTDIAGLIGVSGHGKVLTPEGEFNMPTQITVNCPSC